MDPTEGGLIITSKEPKENLQYDRTQLIQSNGASKIYKIIIQQSYPGGKQTVCKVVDECTSKSKSFENGVSQASAAVHPLDCSTSDKFTHLADDDDAIRNKNENSVALGRSSSRKSTRPCRFSRYQNNESVIAFPNTLQQDSIVSPESVISRKRQQSVNFTSKKKNVEAPITPGRISVTEGSMISHSTSKGRFDFNFIKNYWIAAFASNPEYGLYELPPQNGYCCPFCDFVGKDSNGVLIHWKAHAGEQQFSFDYQHGAFLLEQHSSAKNLQNKPSPNKCHLCHKNFSRNMLLKKHMVCHHNSEPFTCNVCNQSFFLKRSLDSHIKIHSITRHKCTHCGKVYAYEIALKRHLRTVHQA